jgi:hypothetical protein
MNIKKMIPYLLLNIAISAVTMLAVILIWNALHPSMVDTKNLNALISTPAQTKAADLPPLDQKTIEIQSVFLPGDLEDEKINLKNVGSSPIDLAGWGLSNSQGDQYVLPALTLYPNGAVDIYSKAGINTAVELYANSAQAFWKSGETAVLTDSAGNERSRYSVP